MNPPVAFLPTFLPSIFYTNTLRYPRNPSVMRKNISPVLHLILLLACFVQKGMSQPGERAWTKDGSGFWSLELAGFQRTKLPENKKELVVPAEWYKPEGSPGPMQIAHFSWDSSETQMLLFTNTRRVWRYNTRGDYWLLDTRTKALKKLGGTLPSASLMFAKFSPDGKKVAYVSNYNIYVEDIASGKITPLTKDGNRRNIYGTFDWVYEEEFGCRDGFRWSPDGTAIAFWHSDAEGTRDFLMINNTDSIYSYTIPVEYPKTGESPSAVKAGIVSIASGNITWLQLPGHPREHYLPRMEWIPGTKQLILQQLNRKQQESTLYTADAEKGITKAIHKETDNAWIDVKSTWGGNIAGWDWLNNGKEFVWVSEKDGWRHAWRIGLDGKKELLLTKGAYDLENIIRIDEKNNRLYFTASPENATQKYLYVCALDGKTNPKRLTPAQLTGTNSYEITPNGTFAFHRFSSHQGMIPPAWITLPSHQTLSGKNQEEAFAAARSKTSPTKFFQVTTEDGVTLDGWMVLPDNFDSTLKYPVVFHVYGEPAATTVNDQLGTGSNRLYKGNMSADGYIYISLDNRGTPAPKGREWRKSIYRKVGVINARDQAMAAKQIMKWPFVDPTRIAVWGWSGGGSMTLNLLFRYPEIYSTGIAIAAVANQLTYDNIYQERYMGLPQENRADFLEGSPVTYAKNLKGNLLYIHGTGDDNVHYQNAELLINELIKHNKQFSLMSYPNRSHSISEGEGTNEHLRTLYTEYLKKHCPPGGRK